VPDIHSASRRYGVLLPIPSLPASGPIGNLGAPARSWLDWLHRAGATIWQVLPTGPLGYGNSPYSSPSSFALNPLLLSVEDLLESGWIDERPHGSPPGPRIDYQVALQRLEPLLRRAWERLVDSSSPRREAFDSWRAQRQQAAWLDDWALFIALKAELDGRAWFDWPDEIRRRLPDALAGARARLSDEIAFHGFVQFLLAEQVASLRVYAQRLGIEILGDLPFYPALDSADVWSRQDLFDLGDNGRPRNVAGVPPDAFSRTGQLWGNPVYRWARHAADGYHWWAERVAAGLRIVDWLRIDHFRAFAAYWAVPAGHGTAVDGQWCPGPGEAFFEAMRTELGELPFVAEDLGIITDEVRQLRRDTGLRGMRVLQFGFETAASEHAPSRVPEDVIVYTGTHDNDTTRSWFTGLRGAERQRVLRHLAEPGRPHWSLLRLAMETPAGWAIAPVQDLLGLGSEARLNTPGHAVGQWAWRLETLPPTELADELRELAEATDR
jgi:4-alpha-glucanotransferase